MTSTIATTGPQITVYAAGPLHADRAHECATSGCYRMERDAREDSQCWTVVDGRVTGPNGAHVVLEWASACERHLDDTVAAVADVMAMHGSTWEIQTLTYNHAVEVAVGITKIVARSSRREPNPWTS